MWAFIAELYSVIDAHWTQVQWRSQDTENPVQVTKDDEYSLKTKRSGDSTHRLEKLKE